MTAKERKLLISQGRNEFGHYGKAQVCCTKCKEPKRPEETVGNYLSRICYNCVVLEWNRQKLELMILRKKLRTRSHK